MVIHLHFISDWKQTYYTIASLRGIFVLIFCWDWFLAYQFLSRHIDGLPHVWASYQILKIAGCACAGNAGNVFPHRRFQKKRLVNDPDMHHGTCVTHVPWCMSGSLTCGDGENVPDIPGACAPAILRIWQEAHGTTLTNADVRVRRSRTEKLTIYLDLFVTQTNLNIAVFVRLTLYMEWQIAMWLV